MELVILCGGEKEYQYIFLRESMPQRGSIIVVGLMKLPCKSWGFSRKALPQREQQGQPWDAFSLSIGFSLSVQIQRSLSYSWVTILVPEQYMMTPRWCGLSIMPKCRVTVSTRKILKIQDQVQAVQWHAWYCFGQEMSDFG